MYESKSRLRLNRLLHETSVSAYFPNIKSEADMGPKSDLQYKIVPYKSDYYQQVRLVKAQ